MFIHKYVFQNSRFKIDCQERNDKSFTLYIYIYIYIYIYNINYKLYLNNHL